MPPPSPEVANQTEVGDHAADARDGHPALVIPALTVALRQDEPSAWQKVAVYRCLQALSSRGLKVEPTSNFIASTSGHWRVPLPQEEEKGPRKLQAAASNTLARLARHHFNPVMTELQHHLKPFVQPDEFTLLTLGKIAATNVFNCIPFLGITLTTLQTVMRHMEDGRRRQALCKALKQMCRAIRIYLRKWEKVSYPRISVQRFSTYLFPLYACITRTWLPERDPQVKLAVLKALRPVLSVLLPRTDFQAQIHRDILLLTAQYESGLEPLLITQILGQILEASLVNSNPIPRTHVEPLAFTLIRQISSTDHRHQPQGHSQENCTEISHVFLQLARLHPSELLRVFQKNLEEGQEGARTVVLRSLSEIVGAQLPELWSQRVLCVKVVKVVLADDATGVRLATLRAIGQLLRAGYLEKVEGWSLNYVSLQLAVSAHRLTHPTLKLTLGGLEEKAVERAATEALRVAVASGRGGGQELWARLLGYLLQPHCATSAAPLCHTLSLLAEQRWRWGLQRLETGKSPTPQELMARLLSLAVSPLEGSSRGAAALLLLSTLRREMLHDMAENWWVEVPVMVRYLEGHSKYTLPASTWEQKLLEFLKKSVRQKRSSSSSAEERGRWILSLAKELARQRKSWPGSSAEQAFLCKASGVALSAVGDAEGVTLQLRDLLLHTDYTDEDQRKGACQCLGYCAEGQLATVLEALGRFEMEISEGEESTCLLFGQGLPQPEKSRVKSALLGLYGSTATRAPREQLRPPSLERIVAKMLHHYLTAGGLERARGDAELALSFARSVSEVSLAIQRPGDPPAFRMPQKQALLDHLVALLKAQPLDRLVSPICQEVLVALRHLSQVPEMLSPEENTGLAELCLSHLLPLPPSGLVGDASQALYRGAWGALSGLLETLLEEWEGPEGGSAWLQRVFQLLGYCLASEREWERARSVQLGAHLLRARHRKTRTLPQVPWGPFSPLVGMLAPLTYDALGTTRQGAADCIGILLSLQGAALPQKFKGEEQRLCCIRQDLLRKSARRVLAASRQLAKLVSQALPPEETLPFLQALVEQLGAIGTTCDQATLLWFKVAVRERGMDLRDQVCDLVGIIGSRLQHSEEPDPRRCLAGAICLLAEHHRKAVCTSLLQQPLLPPRARKELWTALASYKNFLAPILKLFLSWLKVGGGGEVGIHSCMSVFAALQEVVQAMDSCTELIPLLSALSYAILCWLSQEGLDEMLTMVACSVLERNEQHGAGPAAPRGLAVGALRAIYSKVFRKAVVELDSGDAWTFLMEPENSFKGVTLLGRAFLTCSEDSVLDGLLRRFLSSLSSPRVASRDLSLAFCVELTGHRLLHGPETLPLLLQGWLARAQDGAPTLRAVSVRGLGNVVEAAPQEAKKHQEALLVTFLQAAGDSTSLEVAREGLDALRKVGQSKCFRKRWHEGGTLRAVVSQAREHLRHTDDALRTTAFELLRQLAGAAPPKCSKSLVKEVARDNLAALLLHLKDPNPAVAEACWGALNSWAPFVGLQDLLADVEARPLLMDVSGACHARLMGRVCRQLADPVLLETVLAGVPPYLSCTWEEIQLAACKLAGILTETMDTLRLGHLDLEPLLQALQALVHHSGSAAVKIAASEVTGTVQQRWRECQGRAAQGRQQRVPAFCGWFFRRQRRGSQGGTSPRAP